jgi:hypothetical protein
MPGRFIRSRDLEFFDTINKELVGDVNSGKSGIINQEVVIYKISVYETKSNLYGEASSGKTYKNGIKVNCIIEAEDFDFEVTDFGPDLNQNGTFSFIRQSLIDVNFVPDIGDVIEWNYAYWEINAMNENQLVGGDQQNNHSLICTAFLTEQTGTQVKRSRAY